jgi:putative flippase GtrA
MVNRSHRFHHPHILMDNPAKRRFLKYLGLGVVAFIIDALVFQGVVSLLGASPYIARVASFVVATSAAWWMNRTVTFRDAGSTRPELQWAKFFAANIVGGAVNYLMFALTLTALPLTRAYPVLALAVGSLSGVAFNYTAYKRYVFRTNSGSRPT